MAHLLESSCILRENRELLVLAVWLMLLTGSIEYDIGQYRQAELSRVAAFRIGRETGHGEIIAWSFEMSALVCVDARPVGFGGCVFRSWHQGGTEYIGCRPTGGAIARSAQDFLASRRHG